MHMTMLLGQLPTTYFWLYFTPFWPYFSAIFPFKLNLDELKTTFKSKNFTKPIKNILIYRIYITRIWNFSHIKRCKTIFLDFPHKHFRSYERPLRKRWSSESKTTTKNSAQNIATIHIYQCFSLFFSEYVQKFALSRVKSRHTHTNIHTKISAHCIKYSREKISPKNNGALFETKYFTPPSQRLAKYNIIILLPKKPLNNF